MLKLIVQIFHYDWNALYAFNFIILRALFATLTALFISLITGPSFIRILAIIRIKQIIRIDGPKTHLIKSGTPTMGGILILISIGISTLLWSDINNRFIWIVLFVILCFGIIGLIDDYRKIVYNNSNGMKPSEKYFWQSLISIVAALYLFFSISEVDNVTVFKILDSFHIWLKSNFYFNSANQINLIVPVLKTIHYQLSVGQFILLAYFVIIGTSNAVNLTDGLDGLAIMLIVLISFGLGVFSYFTGHAYYAKSLLIPYITGASELIIFCGAIIGAGLAFLLYNIHPAQIFMGDVGALALGSGLGTIAVIIRQEIILFIMGGVFVAETLSVIIQVIYFKYTKKRYGIGKRIFLMAPLHHHYEKKGWKETQIVMRFWIITIILVLFSLSTLTLH